MILGWSAFSNSPFVICLEREYPRHEEVYIKFKAFCFLILPSGFAIGVCYWVCHWVFFVCNDRDLGVFFSARNHILVQFWHIPLSSFANGYFFYFFIAHTLGIRRNPIDWGALFYRIGELEEGGGFFSWIVSYHYWWKEGFPCAGGGADACL